VIQLSQVLLNALRNAIEALQQVQQRVIEIQINTTQEQVTLSITDTGPGLTPENLEQVGTAFFSTKSTGLGLGLSISHNIMAKHQGTLSVANASRTGACVTLTLPVNANRLPE
jgi:C4-dicarboxylate-specific signal transduction histidine kinase